MTRPFPFSRGFTLVELLVVIGIIALLMSMLLPSLAKARQSAQKAACASNMRQIGIAMNMFANEHDGRLPDIGTDSSAGDPENSPSWIYTLAKYLGDVDAVRICPADPKADERLANRATSYALNSYCTHEFWGGKPPKMTKLKPPSETIVLFTLSDQRGSAATEDHIHSIGWFSGFGQSNWDRIIADIQPNRFGGKRFGDTVGSANYLYADGHVDAIPASQIKAWADQNFDFAKPKNVPTPPPAGPVYE